MDIKKVNSVEEFLSLSVDQDGNTIFPICKSWAGEYEWGTYNHPYLTKEEEEPEPVDPESILEVLKIFSLEHLWPTISEELNALEIWDHKCEEEADWYGGYRSEHIKELNGEKFLQFLKSKN